MKQLALIMLLIGISALWCLDITGDWNGLLDVQVTQLRLVIHITETDSGFSGTFDSPDQSVAGIPLTSVIFQDSLLTFTLDSASLSYTGHLVDNVISGTFSQMGQDFPLQFTREALPEPVFNRPQDPHEPFPYYTEEVTFPNSQAGIELSGTLTLPSDQGVYPVVVMITGSGPQDRNEEVFKHKPFLIIADYLARYGVASLRYDDRGIGKSTGDFSLATSFDLATDAAAAVQYLKTRKEVSTIGLLGHSEGGIIAPIVASRTPDVDFIILLAGTGVRGDKLLLMQQEAIMRVSSYPEEDIQQILTVNTDAFDLVIQAADLTSLTPAFESFIRNKIAEKVVEIPANTTEEDFITMQVNSVCSPWMFEFIRLDPSLYLEKVTCPVLALNGSKDLQVPAKANLSAIKAALSKGGNNNVTVREFSGLNHLFQKCTTGSPDEYAQIEQTMYPGVLSKIAVWIRNLSD